MARRGWPLDRARSEPVRLRGRVMSGVARRLLLAVPTLLGAATLVFFFIHMIPGDPVDVMLGETASFADRARLRAALGLERPLLEQYSGFLVHALRGDLV